VRSARPLIAFTEFARETIELLDVRPRETHHEDLLGMIGARMAVRRPTSFSPEVMFRFA
jgi:hypothetical protein